MGSAPLWPSKITVAKFFGLPKSQKDQKGPKMLIGSRKLEYQQGTNLIEVEALNS